MLFFITFCFSQVGIGTNNPTSTLDINGDLRIRSTSSTFNESAAKDSILVVDNMGNSKRISSKIVVNSYLKTAIKGYFSTGALVNLTLSAGSVKIPFNYAEFDVNSEFNSATSTFIAKQDGIYAVKAQTKSDASVGISTNFGIAILKNNIVVARNTFANVGVIGVNVTPPVRYIETLVSLNTGDTITFELISNLLSVAILGTNEDCFFTIQQIR